MRFLDRVIRIGNTDCKIGIGNYTDPKERIAIVANDFYTEEPYATLTVNLPDWPMRPEHVILDINNIPGIDLILMKAGIVGPCVDYLPAGFCNYPVHKLLV